MYDTTWAGSWTPEVTTWAPQLVTPVECDRCGGTGDIGYGRVEHAGAVRRCFKCHGTGEVEGDEATIEAARVAKNEAARAERRMEKLRAWEATQVLPGGAYTAAQWGLWRLQNTGRWDEWNAVVDAIAARGADLAAIEAQLAVAQ